MTTTVRWIRIQPEVYHMIYNNLQPVLMVHGSYTHMGDGDDEDDRRMDTDWGFKDATVPLIRSECRGKTWIHFIAEVEVREEVESA